MVDGDFEIQVMDDPDYEDLIAEVLYKGEYCFLLSQEAGFQNMEIRVQCRPSGLSWQFTLIELENAIGRAKERLWTLRREEPR